MEARIPIADGLRSISEQETNPKLRAVIEEVAGQIEAGNSVTDALNQHRDVFGEVYIETIRAAETSGNMVKVLGRLAEMLERQYESNKNIKGALIYPICVLIAMVLGSTFLMIFVIPKFTTMYATKTPASRAASRARCWLGWRRCLSGSTSPIRTSRGP